MGNENERGNLYHGALQRGSVGDGKLRDKDEVLERRPGSGRDASHAWWWVHCTACDASELNPMPDYCGLYGSPFEVDLDYGEVRPDELFEGGVTDLWKYRALYPLSSHRMGSSSA